MPKKPRSLDESLEVLEFELEYMDERKLEAELEADKRKSTLKEDLTRIIIVFGIFFSGYLVGSSSIYQKPYLTEICGVIALISALGFVFYLGKLNEVS